MKVILTALVLAPLAQTIGQTLTGEHLGSSTAGKNAEDYNKYIKDQLKVQDQHVDKSLTPE